MATNSFNPRFTNYDSLAAYLTAQGSTFKRALPLYTIGSDANDANIIGHWGFNSNNLIAPFGEIDLTKVTPSRFGTVASVSGSVITLTEGHNLPASFSGLQWDTSAASELFYGTACTVAANVFTASNTAGIAAGDIVYDVQSSEFTIGGATRNCEILSGSAVFSGSALSVINGKANLRLGTFGASKHSYSVRFNATWTKSADANDQLAMCGFQRADGQIYVAGFRRIANANSYAGLYGADSSLTPVSLVGAITDAVHFRFYPTVTFIMMDALPSGTTTPSVRVYQSAWQLTEAPAILRLHCVPASSETVVFAISKVA